MKIGTTELILILAIALLVVGPTVLPKMGKAMGRTIANFKRGVEYGEDEEETDEVSVDKKDSDKDAPATRKKTGKKAVRDKDK